MSKSDIIDLDDSVYVIESQTNVILINSDEEFLDVSNNDCETQMDTIDDDCHIISIEKNIDNKISIVIDKEIEDLNNKYLANLCSLMTKILIIEWQTKNNCTEIVPISKPKRKSKKRNNINMLFLMPIKFPAIDDIYKDITYEVQLFEMKKNSLNFNFDLVPYQMSGSKWMQNLYEKGFSCILNDEAGLDKMMQCLSLISNLYTNKMADQCLVITTANSIPQWMLYFKQYCCQLKVYAYHSEKVTNRNTLRGLMHVCKKQNISHLYSVIITTYEMLQNDIKSFEDIRFSVIVVDKAERLKYENAIFKTIESLKNTDNFIILTESNLLNQTYLFFNHLKLILPHYFNYDQKFIRWLDTNSHNVDHSNKIWCDAFDNFSDSGIGSIDSRNHDGYNTNAEKKLMPCVSSIVKKIYSVFCLQRLVSEVGQMTQERNMHIVLVDMPQCQANLYQLILQSQLKRPKKEYKIFEKDLKISQNNTKENLDLCEENNDECIEQEIVLIPLPRDMIDEDIGEHMKLEEENKINEMDKTMKFIDNIQIHIDKQNICDELINIDDDKENRINDVDNHMEFNDIDVNPIFHKQSKDLYLNSVSKKQEIRNNKTPVQFVDDITQSTHWTKHFTYSSIQTIAGLNTSILNERWKHFNTNRIQDTVDINSSVSQQFKNNIIDINQNSIQNITIDANNESRTSNLESSNDNKPNIKYNCHSKKTSKSRRSKYKCSRSPIITRSLLNSTRPIKIEDLKSKSYKFYNLLSTHNSYLDNSKDNIYNNFEKLNGIVTDSKLNIKMQDFKDFKNFQHNQEPNNNIYGTRYNKNQLLICTTHPCLVKFIAEPLKEKDNINILNESGKFHILDKLLRLIRERNQKVVILCHFVKTKELLFCYLDETQYEYFKMTSNMCLADRHKQIQLFEENVTSSIFVSTFQLVGAGIKSADYLLFLESQKNEMCMKESIAKFSTKEHAPLIIQLIASNSIDQNNNENLLNEDCSNSNIQKHYISTDDDFNISSLTKIFK